jgi:hypothetical protein
MIRVAVSNYIRAALFTYEVLNSPFKTHSFDTIIILIYILVWKIEH